MVNFRHAKDSKGSTKGICISKSLFDVVLGLPAVSP